MPKVINVGDDDLTQITDSRGRLLNVFFGTTGDDFIFVNTSVPTIVIGGPGRDSITKAPGSAMLTAYGDNALDGFGVPSIGARGAAGADRLDVGAGDEAKSGSGRDLYVLHGTGFSYAEDGPARLSIDPRFDTLTASGDLGFEVVDVDFRTKNGRIVESVTVEFSSRNRLVDGQTAELLIGVEREGPRPDYVLEGKGGGLEAAERLLDRLDFIDI